MSLFPLRGARAKTRPGNFFTGYRLNPSKSNGGSSRRLARRAIEHAFKRPHGNTLQSANLDHGDFSAGCGVVGRVPAEAEITLAGLRDGNCQRGVLIIHIKSSFVEAW
jgi:hypothetical protein